MARAQGKLLPFTLAIVVHVALGAFMFVSLDWAPKIERVPDVDIVQAVVIDESAIRAEQERQRKIEEDRKRKLQEERKRKEAEKKRREDEIKRKREAELKRKEEAERKRKQAEAERKRKVEQERKRKAEAEKKRKAAEEKKRKAEAEKKRKAEEARKRKEEAERKRRAEEERQRLAAEEALNRQMEEEMRALDAARKRQEERLMISYVDAIRQDVQRSWRKPPGTTPDMECTVRVNQIPGGEVVDAKIVSCSTNDENFKRSVVNAVYKASPLPKPADAAIFQRVLEFKFNPQE